MVVPDGGKFPPGMKPVGGYHNLTFNPENGEHSLTVTGPLPGPWFMMAYAMERKFIDFTQEVSGY